MNALHKQLKMVARTSEYGLRIDWAYNGWVSACLIDVHGLEVTDKVKARALMGGDRESNVIGAAEVAVKKAINLARIRGIDV